MRFLIFLIIVFTSSTIQTQTTEKENLGLKDHYRDYFPIGASIGPFSLKGKDSALIIKEFSSITAENIMKMGPIHPEEDEYSWEPADQMMAFAEKHNLKVRGHTLCWHNQTPKWMFVDAEGQNVDKEILLARLKEHIFSVARRYKDRIYAWDVVNEVIADDPNTFYRNSRWYEICGKEFIWKAFQYAHEAVPEALLYYNDYNALQPNKREKIIQMIKEMQQDGIPIHGIGLQGHWNIYSPSEEQLRDGLTHYAELGLDIQITELDVSVYPSESERRAKKPDESDAFTPEMEKAQTLIYKMIFDVFRDYKGVITGVTFWNVSDAHSWLDNFPVRGRKNYPLLFDQDRKRKKAYYSVVIF